MKCPKCGFTSFDYLNECKKCGVDISDVRSTLGVIAISPDDRAAAAPSGLEPELIDNSFDETGEILGTDDLGTGGDDFLGSADDDAFEETFEGLVEPTSYDDQQGGEAPAEEPLAAIDEAPSSDAAPADDSGAGSPEFDKSEVEPEEEFLDLDFGGIFEDEE